MNPTRVRKEERTYNKVQKEQKVYTRIGSRIERRIEDQYILVKRSTYTPSYYILPLLLHYPTTS
jgi:hypothetical protein